MSIATPSRNLNRWLESVLLDMLEQNTEDSRLDLTEAIRILVAWSDPGLIEEHFEEWILRYQELLAQHKSNQSTAPLNS